MNITEVACPTTVKLPNMVVSPLTCKSLTDNVVSNELLIELMSNDKLESPDILLIISVESAVDKLVSLERIEMAVDKLLSP